MMPPANTTPRRERIALALHLLAGVVIGAVLGWYWLALTAQRIATLVSPGAAPW